MAEPVRKEPPKKGLAELFRERILGGAARKKPLTEDERKRDPRNQAEMLRRALEDN